MVKNSAAKGVGIHIGAPSGPTWSGGGGVKVILRRLAIYGNYGPGILITSNGIDQTLLEQVLIYNNRDWGLVMREHPFTWPANTTVLKGQVCVPSPQNQHMYEAQNSGTTGSSQPSFQTGSGSMVTDNQVTWKEIGGWSGGAASFGTGKDNAPNAVALRDCRFEENGSTALGTGGHVLMYQADVNQGGDNILFEHCGFSHSHDYTGTSGNAMPGQSLYIQGFIGVTVRECYLEMSDTGATPPVAGFVKIRNALADTTETYWARAIKFLGNYFHGTGTVTSIQGTDATNVDADYAAAIVLQDNEHRAGPNSSTTTHPLVRFGSNTNSCFAYMRTAMDADRSSHLGQYSGAPAMILQDAGTGNSLVWYDPNG